MVTQLHQMRLDMLLIYAGRGSQQEDVDSYKFSSLPVRRLQRMRILLLKAP